MRASQECILDCNRYELLQRSKEQACHETSKGLEGQNSCRQTVLYCHLERHLRVLKQIQDIGYFLQRQYR